MFVFLSELTNIILQVKDIVETIGFIISIYFAIKISIWNNKQKFILDSIDDLYKTLENKSNYKWLIGEKFYKITNVRMNFDDIKDLLQDSNVTEIIYLIKKYKRVYHYKNKKLVIINEFQNTFIKLFDKVFLFFSISLFGIFFILSSFVFAFSHTIQDKIVFGIYIIISLVYLMIFLTWKDDKRKAKELIT